MVDGEWKMVNGEWGRGRGHGASQDKNKGEKGYSILRNEEERLLFPVSPCLPGWVRGRMGGWRKVSCYWFHVDHYRIAEYQSRDIE